MFTNDSEFEVVCFSEKCFSSFPAYQVRDLQQVLVGILHRMFLHRHEDRVDDDAHGDGELEERFLHKRLHLLLRMLHKNQALVSTTRRWLWEELRVSEVNVEKLTSVKFICKYVKMWIIWICKTRGNLNHYFSKKIFPKVKSRVQTLTGRVKSALWNFRRQWKRLN